MSTQTTNEKLTTEPHKVALLGASGKIGPFLLKALVEDGFVVTVIARESSTATYDSSVTVTRVSDSFTKPEMMRAFQGQDAVVVALAHAANADHHRTLFDAAVEAKVPHFIANHWGSNAELPIIRQSSERSAALDDDVDYFKTKENLGTSWTAIIPGIFFDLAFKFGLLGFNLKNKTAQIWDDGNSSFSASTNTDIAATTCAVLKHPAASRNRYVYTSSFETTQNQLLASVERLTGVKWEVQNVRSADKVKEANEQIAAGAQGMAWLMAQGTLAVKGLFGGDKYQSDFTKSGRSSNDELGLKKSSADEAVATAFGESSSR